MNGMSITKLAWNNNKCNRTRSILVTVSITLTMLSLVIVASYGYGIIKSERVNAGLYSGSHYGCFRNVSPDQIHTMELRSEFEEIGVMASVGVTEQEDSLQFADMETLELNHMIEQLEDGLYPLEKNEITASRDFFERCGVSEPKLGDTVTVSARGSLEVPYKDEEFVICGILKEREGSTKRNSAAFVSQKYYESLVPESERRYHAYFTLNPSVSINSDNDEEVISELASLVGVDKEYVTVNTLYLMWKLDPGYETICVCAVIIFCIVLFSVVVIYNIFQVGIRQKIQEYGKIRALGATRRQMRQLIWREGMILGLIGIPLGLIAGVDIARISFAWLNNMGGAIYPEGYIEVSPVSPVMLSAAALICFVTVWISLKKPMRTVASLSPVEAIRYQADSGKKRGRGIRKGRRELTVAGLTMANLSAQKKRTVVTIVTMGLSCTLFVVLANLAGNMDARYDARKTVQYGDFMVSLNYKLNDKAYPENNLNVILRDDLLNEEFTEQIREIDGVKDVRSQRMLAMKRETKEGGETPEYESVLVMNREEFDWEIEQGSLLGEFSYDSVTDGGGIVYGWSHFMEEDGVHMGDKVRLSLEDGVSSRECEAGVFGSFGSCNANWVITEDTFRSLGFEGDPVYRLWIECEMGCEKEVGEALNHLLEESNHLEMESYEETLRVSESGVMMIKVFCYALSAMIAVISFMNMANTLVVSVVTRRQEFGMMQAIGMTNSQLNRSLQGEGLLFTIGTVLVSMLVGVPCGYGLFRYGKENSWFSLHEYHFPAAELLIMAAFLALFQIMLSFVLTRNVKKESVIERIRYQG